MTVLLFALFILNALDLLVFPTVLRCPESSAQPATAASPAAFCIYRIQHGLSVMPAGSTNAIKLTKNRLNGKSP